MEAPSNTSTGERLVVHVLCSRSHETWHLIFCQLNLSAAESSQTEVCDLVLVGWSSHYVGIGCLWEEREGSELDGGFCRCFELLQAHQHTRGRMWRNFPYAVVATQGGGIQGFQKKITERVWLKESIMRNSITTI